MTIKQLLGFGTTTDPVEVLEAMTSEQLLVHCEPYIRVVELKEPAKEETKELELGDTPATPKERGPKKARTTDDWMREVAALQRKHGASVSGIGELPKEIKK